MSLKDRLTTFACLAGVLALGLGAIGCAGTGTNPTPPAPIQFVYTSDAHYGITRATFQGAVTVNGQPVNAAMIGRINSLPTVTLPLDGGLRQGELVGAMNFVAMTGDIANRSAEVYNGIRSDVIVVDQLNNGNELHRRQNDS